MEQKKTTSKNSSNLVSNSGPIIFLEDNRIVNNTPTEISTITVKKINLIRLILESTFIEFIYVLFSLTSK
jgi:hypothetical protein